MCSPLRPCTSLLVSHSSQRKWKMKLKEWNFEKNLSEEDKKIMIAKREKRLRDEGKETTFFHHGIIIPGSKIDSAKRKKPDQETATISPSAGMSTFLPGLCLQ